MDTGISTRTILTMLLIFLICSSPLHAMDKYFSGGDWFEPGAWGWYDLSYPIPVPTDSDSVLSDGFDGTIDDGDAYCFNLTWLDSSLSVQSTGSLNCGRDSSTSLINGDLYLYGQSQTNLDITSGGSVLCQKGYIGYDDGTISGSASATVDGVGSIWTVATGLLVGYFNTGNSLSITNGGVVSSYWGTVGGYHWPHPE